MIKLKQILNEQGTAKRDFLDKYYQTRHPIDDFKTMARLMDGEIMTPTRRNMSTINVTDRNSMPTAFGRGLDVDAADNEFIFASKYALPLETIESFESVSLALAIPKQNGHFDKMYSMYLLNELPRSNSGVGSGPGSDRYESGRLYFKLTDKKDTAINRQDVKGFTGEFGLEGRPFQISVYFPVG